MPSHVSFMLQYKSEPELTTDNSTQHSRSQTSYLIVTTPLCGWTITAGAQRANDMRAAFGVKDD